MHRGHLLRDRAGIGQDALRRGVQACYWHDEAVVDVLRAIRDLGGALALHMQVVFVDAEEHDDQQRDEDDDDPGPREELGRGDHQRHQQRGERAQSVDTKAALPALLLPAQPPPVDHHAAL